MSPSVVALIGARSGSERVPGKNVRLLAGHPLLAYAIETARQSGVFERIVVSTDSEEIARSHAGTAPTSRSSAPTSMRPRRRPTSNGSPGRSPRLGERYDLFAIVRATNPFRGPEVIRGGFEQLLATPEADSIRAVERVKQHPGEDVGARREGRTMMPLLDQSHLDVAWHAGQYQALPPVYVQNSALEIAWTRVVAETGTREGRVLAPFLTEGYEGCNIDDEDYFAFAETLVAARAGDRCAARRRARDVSCADRDEARLARDALLRRRLAPLALRQGDDGRRARRLVGGDRLARLSHRPRRRRRATSRRSSSAATRVRSRRSTGISTAAPGKARARSSRRRSEGSRTRCSTSRAKALGVSVAELFGGPTGRRSRSTGRTAGRRAPAPGR